MNYHPLYLPMFGMMILTITVWFTMYALRLSYVIKHRIGAQKLHKPEQVNHLLSDRVNAASNNLKNLFELPLLFYIVVIVAAQLYDHSIVSNIAAWSFLLFRIIHSFIHCCNGQVLARFIAYVLSSLSLFVFIINVFIHMLNQIK